MVFSQANQPCYPRRQNRIGGIPERRRDWREWTSAEDEELLSDVDAGAAHHPVAAIWLGSPGADIRFPDDRAVTREPVLEPERTALLPELEVRLRNRLPRVKHSNEVIEVLPRLRLRVAPDQ